MRTFYSIKAKLVNISFRLTFSNYLTIKIMINPFSPGRAKLSTKYC